MKSQIEAKIKELSKKINLLQKDLTPLQKEKSDLIKELKEIEFKELLPLTPSKVVNSNYFVFEQAESFKELRKFMSQYKFLSCDGFWSSTQKKALKIALRQTSPVDMQLKEIMDFLPHMPFDTFASSSQVYMTKDKMDCSEVKVFSIFESSLSERGVYNLVVDKDNQAGLIKTSYGSSTLLKVLPFEEMISYLWKHHPYEVVREEEE